MRLETNRALEFAENSTVLQLLCFDNPYDLQLCTKILFIVWLKPLLLKQDLQTSDLPFKICTWIPLIDTIFIPLFYHKSTLKSTSYE